MNNWPKYKGFWKEVKTAKAVVKYVEGLGIEGAVDEWYLETFIKSGKEKELDFDAWIDADCTRGASVHVRYIEEYNPLDVPAWKMDAELVFKANTEGIKSVIIPAHYEIVGTRYTAEGIEEEA